MMPVQQGTVKSKFDIAASGTGVSQLTQRVTPKRSTSHFVVAERRIVHAEAIVMATRDDDIPLSRIRCDTYPFVGAELHRVELLNKRLILRYWNFRVMHHPFSL